MPDLEQSVHCLGVLPFVVRVFLNLIFLVAWSGGMVEMQPRDKERLRLGGLQPLPAMYLPASYVLPHLKPTVCLQRKRT